MESEPLNKDLDLSCRIAGVKFKNPILPASCELVFDGPSARRLAQRGVGGLASKTFTTPAASRIRPRPYHFPLARFGSSFRRSGSFYSLAAPHVESMEVVLEKNIPDMVRVCREFDLPLIASFYENPQELKRWQDTAAGMQRAGADLLELNFSSPTMRGALEKSPQVGFAILEAVGRNVDIPLGVKLSPMLEPLIEAVRGWQNRGVSFISAHNAPSGFFVDVEKQTPYGAPLPGGYLMGRPFLPISLARVVRILREVDIDIIGVGGIFKAEDALQYLLCGSAACGLATAAYQGGVGVFSELLKGLTEWMIRKGYRTVADFRGNVLEQVKAPADFLAGEKAPFALPPHTPYLPRIDSSRCKLCLNCCRSCLYEALYLDKQQKAVTVREDLCWSCGFCVGICPEEAITLVDRGSGRTVWNGRGEALTSSKP